MPTKEKEVETQETKKTELAGVMPILGLGLFMGTIMFFIFTSKNL
jgi:hypothetical protein